MRTLSVLGIGVVAATNVQIAPLTVFIDILGAVALVGGVGVGLVALYRARSDKGLTNMQSMEILFEKQRDVNLELLKLRDAQIEELEEKLEHANGTRGEIEKKLKDCQRERTLLRNQIRGLEKTIAEIHRQNP